MQNGGTIGENMTVRRSKTPSVSDNVASYMHNQVRMGWAKSVFLWLCDRPATGKLGALGVNLQACGGTNPLAANVDSLNPDDIERERAVLIAEAKESGKADEIIEKMVEGRLRKFYEEVVLTSQVFVIDETRISKGLENAAGSWRAGGVDGFARFELGEVLTREADFMAEVAAQSATPSFGVSEERNRARPVALIRQGAAHEREQNINVSCWFWRGADGQRPIRMTYQPSTVSPLK